MRSTSLISVASALLLGCSVGAESDLHEIESFSSLTSRADGSSGVETWSMLRGPESVVLRGVAGDGAQSDVAFRRVEDDLIVEAPGCRFSIHESGAMAIDADDIERCEAGLIELDADLAARHESRADSAALPVTCDGPGCDVPVDCQGWALRPREAVLATCLGGMLVPAVVGGGIGRWIGRRAIIGAVVTYLAGAALVCRDAFGEMLRSWDYCENPGSFRLSIPASAREPGQPTPITITLDGARLAPTISAFIVGEPLFAGGQPIHAHVELPESGSATYTPPTAGAYTFTVTNSWVRAARITTP